MICALNQTGKAQLEIYNLLGQKVHTTEVSNSGIHPIEKKLSSGNYIIKVTQNGNLATEKIIIQ